MKLDPTHRLEDLQPHYFPPNLLRPLPIEETEPVDSCFDDLDLIWLQPGMLPEPYWDISMGQEKNFFQTQELFNQALKQGLTPED